MLTEVLDSINLKILLEASEAKPFTEKHIEIFRNTYAANITEGYYNTCNLFLLEPDHAKILMYRDKGFRLIVTMEAKEFNEQIYIINYTDAKMGGLC